MSSLQNTAPSSDVSVASAALLNKVAKNNDYVIIIFDVNLKINNKNYDIIKNYAATARVHAVILVK